MTGGEDIHPIIDAGQNPQVIVLTDGQIDAIANRVEQRFYARIGRKVIERVLWVIGISAVALMAWLGGKGLLR